MKRTLLFAYLLGMWFPAFSFGEETEIPLWQEPAPLTWNDSPEELLTERGTNGIRNRTVKDISIPTLTLYSPSAEKNSGRCIVICPGGGYGYLAMDKEGHAVAAWLQKQGITGAVLKYRLPRPSQVKDGHLIPLTDAQQAIRILRQDAKKYGIKPDQIGIMGFSAGGHLAASASNLYLQETPPGLPGLKDVSARPDFTVLVYPVITFSPIGHQGSAKNLLGDQATESDRAWWSIENRVSRQTPPAFLVHATNDPVKIQNSYLYRDACLEHGIPATLFSLPSGGHGFGMGKPGQATARWPAEMVAFLDNLFPQTEP